MAVTPMKHVEKRREVSRRKKPWGDAASFKVVGTEEGRQLVHDYDNQMWTITGIVTSKELRAVGVDIDDWISRNMIQPLKQTLEVANA